MSPGINDHPRNTGALPKSNRRSDRNRNREKSSTNQDSSWFTRHHYPTTSQHTNNVFQRVSPDWQHQTIIERPISNPRTTKNSNNRSTRTTSSSASYDLADLGPYNSHSTLYPNIYANEDLIPWLKMTPPVDLQTQSPPNLSAKPTNTDRMPERDQVEGRLNQIREYIKVTSTMMDSLSQSTDPRAQIQHEKLGRMVEDLYDSEGKLTKLMEDCQKYWRPNENGELDNEDRRRELELRKKVDESQRKLAQLQEHQAHLVGMQLQVRERLDKARQAQQALLIEDDNEVENDNENDIDDEENGLPSQSNVERLERETEALRGKLQQLENKKRQMDILVQELHAAEMNDRASCSSEGSRIASGQRDKAAELEAMKAQLKHLKALMNETTRCRDSIDAQAGSGSENQDDATNNDVGNDEVYQVEENSASNFSNSFNDAEESIRPKTSGDHLTVEQIQEVTREMKEQQELLQSARAELLRIKQLRPNSAAHTNPTPSVTSSTPPPSIAEKKQSNNDTRKNKRRQLEDFMRKDQTLGSSLNQNGGLEWDSRRGSHSQHSTTSTPGNLWPPPTNHQNASHDHSVDGISGAENLLEMDAQTTIENGFGNNFWGMPTMLSNQASQGATLGSAEYYRQLLLGSQAQQLQMMSATIQQCCQLLWSQQREMQTLKSAVIQLQNQLRHSQLRTSNNLDLQEEHHSNLVRPSTQQQFSSLDGVTLPPSSSLPNLVSLPTSSPAPLSVIPTIANCQQQQQQPPQLNNQVPPGNRANNYWDNFRSYSRQNLLSGSSKSTTECTSTSTIHAPSSSNTASGVIVSSHINNKRNRPQPEHHHHIRQSQHQHQQQQQQQDRESVISSRNNYSLSNEASQQPHQQPQQIESANEEAAASFCHEPRQCEDQTYAKIAKNITEREDLRLILMHCLKVLESRQQNESPLPSSNISNSSESSDDESEAEAQGNSNIPSIENVIAENSAQSLEYADTSLAAHTTDSCTPQYFSEGIEFADAISYEAAFPVQLVSSSNQVDEAAEADESSNSQQVFNNEENPRNEIEGAAAVENSEIPLDDMNIEDEHERLEYVMLDNSQHLPTNQWPHQQPNSRRSRLQNNDNSYNSHNCISCKVDRLQK